MNAPERNVENEFEVRTVTQEKANEQIRSYMTKQLEDLTWLIQGISTAQQPNN